mmetsp:Transcript_3002/g.3299  ORF Transcript_3002/g.3299 Transcript_3002/m.3299 type:complete len:1163 (-) Transcript_3002:547-4035(-)
MAPDTHNSKHGTCDHESVMCVAVIGADGSNVNVFDKEGTAVTFLVPNDTHDPSTSDNAGQKICFSSHGTGELTDALLTQCFDADGLHGEPDETCFCGVDTPHLHAHKHVPELCDAAVSGCNNNNKKSTEISFLGQLTLFPDDVTASAVASAEKSSIPFSDSFPNSCNSSEVKKQMGLRKRNGNAADNNRSLFEVQHGDHMDFLVHNPNTGNIHLEHPCDDCGDIDLHGNLNLVEKRAWINEGSEEEMQLHFFQSTKAPFNLLDAISEFFGYNVEGDKRVAVVKNVIFDACAKVCCNSHVNYYDRSDIGLETEVAGITEVGNVDSKFHVRGICCSSEIPAINSIIEPVTGVHRVQINVTTKIVFVNHNSGVVTAQEIKHKLDKEGFSTSIKIDGGQNTLISCHKSDDSSRIRKSDFHVNGMCCASEIPIIEKILQEWEGISKLSFNTPLRLMHVEHDHVTVTAKEISDALTAQGFEATIRENYGSMGMLKPGVSQFVESTLIIKNWNSENQTGDVHKLMRSKFTKKKVQRMIFNFPSRTLKIDHNPEICSAFTVAEAISTNYFRANILVDGASGGWHVPVHVGETELDEGDETADMLHAKVDPLVFLSGICWLTSMLSFSNENWEFLKWFALLSVAFGIPKTAMKAFRTLRRAQFDANCMMLFATLGAIGLQDYTEAASVSFLFSISEWLESLATSRARNALSAIVQLRPERANLVDIDTGEIAIVPAAALSVGSFVIVRTGDKIPCDGVVVDGKSAVDESSLTGESRPVRKGPNDEVSGGTINIGTTPLRVKNISTVNNSAVSRLIQLVEEAQANRSPTEKMVDQVAKIYTPIVVLLAFSMCTFPWLAGTEVGKYWTKLGLITIVIACPCALIISTPITYVAGLAATAQRGIIVKGGAHLEALGKVKKIAFDKTGTLTQGNFALLHLNVLGDRFTREEVLEYLALMESSSSHPLALALAQAARNENVTVDKNLKVSNHSLIEGEGIVGNVGKLTVYVGNERLFKRLDIFKSISNIDVGISDTWCKNGGTVGYMSIDGDVVCMYCVQDAAREESREVVCALKLMGIETVMLTGDNQHSALAIAREVGLADEDIHSQLLPKEKLDIIAELKFTKNTKNSPSSYCRGNENGFVLMVGDGVNDAPALVIADIGVAMGAGAALAMEM